MNSKVTSILGGAVVIALALVFIVQFQPATGGAQSSGVGTVCAVEVSGECVSATDYWAAFRLLAPRNADEARLRAMGMRRQTAEGLVERTLLVRDAQRLGMAVSDDEVTAELASGRARVSLPADKQRQLGYALGLGEDNVRYLMVKNRQTKKFDPKQYEREVRLVARMSPTDFREFQKKEILAARMRDLVRARVRVGEAEAREQFSREKATATLEYARFDRGFYADVAVDASPAAVDDFAAKHKDEVDKLWDAQKSQFLPECRVTSHILAKFPDAAAGPDEAKAAARGKIDEALERLKKGDDFGAVARALSDDTSASRGGELGCVARGRMVKPFEDAMFALEEGKPSGVVETEYGYHVIRVEKIAKEAEAERIAKQQLTRDRFLQLEAERFASEGAKEVLSAIRGGKPLEEALKAHIAALPRAKAAVEGVPDPMTTHPNRPAIETTLPFNASGDPLAAARPRQDVARMAFGLDKPGDVPNDLVALENGYAVLRLKEKTPVSDEQWEKEREFYVSAMRAAKQSDALAGYLKRLRSQLGGEVKYDGSIVNDAKPKPGEEDPLGGDLGE